MTEEPSGDEDLSDPSPADPGRREEAASPERVEQLARRLDAAGEPYVRVTVVRREPPVSARVGDRAVLTPDGDLVGWVGGAECAQSVVLREATHALATGEPVLLGLAPDPDDVARPGLESFPMTCHSGGTLELFVEPVRPAPRLVVVGDSPVARTLVRLAAELAYDLTAVTGDAGGRSDQVGDRVAVVASTDETAIEDAVGGASAVVVATMGAFDEEALAAAVRADAPYVGLVSSHVRADELFGAVADRTGMTPDAVADAVTVPAGLDIGAETPEEIAVSVLAELVERAHEPAPPESADAARKAEADGALTRDTHDHNHDHVDDQNAGDGPDGETTGDGPDDETATDPVCGMTVEVATAAATVEHGGETYHFCAQGCADAFAADPERFTGQDAEAR